MKEVIRSRAREVILPNWHRRICTRKMVCSTQSKATLNYIKKWDSDEISIKGHSLLTLTTAVSVEWCIRIKEIASAVLDCMTQRGLR